MLSKYNASDIELILSTENPPPLFPPATNRDAWEQLSRQRGSDIVQAIIENAERAAKADIPSLPASLYLEFKRNGERAGYQQPRNIRRQNLTALVLGECFEHKGRFLDPIMDLAWAICEESSWASPAHQGELTDLDFPIIDLNSSLAGTLLAEMEALLGKELDPHVGKRIRDEVDRRLFQPYLTRHDHWWMYNTQVRHMNNWTAVCNSNIVMTALYLERDFIRLSEIIARAARSLDDYLDTYDIDGGSSEGPGPWIFGFSNYTIMAQMLDHRSKGRLNFLKGDIFRKIAEFPIKTYMGGGNWVNFADTESNTTFADGFLIYAAKHFDIPELITLYHDQKQRGVIIDRETELPWMLRRLFWMPEEIPSKPVQIIPNKHDWYSGMHWMFARMDPTDPDALVLAAKGGHNGEMHNQNDVGSFILQLNGEQLIADIGRGRFTRFYFGATRYEDFSCQSYGHSCPVPNGQMQGPLTAAERLGDGNWADNFTEEMRGSNYHATLVEHRADDMIDLMKIEMKKAYPAVSDLDSLVRTIAFHRDTVQGWVELVDDVRFTNQPGTFESVLTTFGRVKIGNDNVIIEGEKGRLQINYDAQIVQARVDLRENVPLTLGICDVSRIVFEFPQAQQSGTIRLEMRPI